MNKIEVPRYYQPQSAVGIDWNNPLTRGLFFYANFNSLSNIFSTKRQNYTTNTAKIIATKTGVGAYSGIGGFSYGSAGAFDNEFSGSFTFTTNFTFANYANNGSTINVITGYCSTAAQGLIVVVNSSNRVTIWLNQTIIASTPTLSVGNNYTISVNRDSTNTYSVSLNGLPLTITPPSTHVLNNGNYTLVFLNDGATRYFQGILHSVVITSNIAPTTTLSANPWQIFQPIQRDIFIPTDSQNYIPQIFSDGFIDTSASDESSVAVPSGGSPIQYATDSFASADSETVLTTFLGDKTETIASNDSPAALATFGAAIPEATTSADSQVNYVASPQATTETSTTADGRTGQTNLLGALTETSVTNDSETVLATLYPGISEGVTTADGETVAGVLGGSSTDSSTSAESSTTGSIYPLDRTEAGATNDSDTVLATLGAVKTEAATVADSETVLATLGGALTDSNTSGESSTTGTIYPVDRTEANATNDAETVLSVLYSTGVDPVLTTQETSGNQLIGIGTLTDPTLGTNESSTTGSVYPADRTETIASSDNEVAFANFLAALLDPSLTTADSETRILVNTVDRTETGSTADSETVLGSFLAANTEASTTWEGSTTGSIFPVGLSETSITNDSYSKFLTTLGNLLDAPLASLDSRTTQTAYYAGLMDQALSSLDSIGKTFTANADVAESSLAVDNVDTLAIYGLAVGDVFVVTDDGIGIYLPYALAMNPDYVIKARTINNTVYVRKILENIVSSGRSYKIVKQGRNYVIQG